MSKPSESWSARQQQPSAISEYTTNIQYISGKGNLVADAPFRVPTCSHTYLASSITYFARCTLWLYRHHSAVWRVPLGSEDRSSHQPGTRRFSTSFTEFLAEVINPHGGCYQTHLSGTIWPSKLGTGPELSSPVNKSRSINTKHCSETMNHLQPDSAMSTPYPPPQCCSYLLTLVDRYTSRPRLMPLHSTESQEVSQTFICFSVPDSISSNWDPQFISKLWNDMCGLFGITMNHTTAYHPGANVVWRDFTAAWRNPRQLNLTGQIGLTKLDWPWVMLRIRTVPKENLNSTSTKMVYSSSLSVSGEFLP